MISFMVCNGFSLLEVRKLYFDEMFEYYKGIFNYLEQRGEAKAGTTEKLKSVDKPDEAVNQLRKQLFKINQSKK